METYDFGYAFSKTDKGRKVCDELSEYIKKIKSDGTFRNGKCLIICGGDRGPVPDAGGFDLVIAADKGLLYALEKNIRPDIVIGDLDSLLPCIKENGGGCGFA